MANIKVLLAKRRNHERNEKIRGIEKEIEELEASKQHVDEYSEEQLEELSTDDLVEVERDTKEKQESNESIQAEIAKKEEEIEALKEQLEEIEEVEEKTEEEEERGNNMNLQLRNKYTDQVAAETFYQELNKAFTLEKRNVTGIEVPKTVTMMILDTIEKYSKLYKLVSVQKTNADGIIQFEDTRKGSAWIDCSKTTPEVNITVGTIALSAYRLAGLVTVCNDDLQDISMLESFVVDQLGKDLAFELDIAIMSGDGNGKPTGIKNGLTAKTIADSIALISAVTEIEGTNKKIVMNNATYSKLITEMMTNNTALGSGVIFNGAQQTLFGYPIITVEKEILKDDEIVAGEFGKYILAERLGFTFSSSEHAKFAEHQTLFKGVGRYDGKRLSDKYFASFKLVQKAPETK